MASETKKAISEIGVLAEELTPNNQAYILNTINTLLYSQKNEKTMNTDESHPKIAII